MLILTRSEIAGLMNFADYVQAVESAFLLHASGKISGPAVMEISGDGGTFHAKGAGMSVGDRNYVAIKFNGNFPENKSRFGLPTIQGAILLCDAVRGIPLAILDSIEITIQRTGAATAIAARHLARTNSQTATICGCGIQGMIQLTALKTVLPLKTVFAYDHEPEVAEKFSEATRAHPVVNLEEAVHESDVIVTCTTSPKFFLKKEWISAGTFIAAVGADSHDKQEIDPKLLASSRVVTDITDQCARIGELHHAIEEGLMTRNDVYCELSDLVCGAKRGRISDDEITIFDSTGTAIQDVASSAIAYERAMEQGIGWNCSL
jgi:ornithine cyclodeaminase/alanine dehydrogenase-like protein (mu-crystallin family)